MKQRADDAEAIITAKIVEDFGRAATEPGLGAAAARFGRTTATRLAALPGHPAYNKARGFTLEDVERLPAIRAFFTDAGVPPLVEVWAGDASDALGRQLAEAGFYAAEVNTTLRAEPGRPTTHDEIELREVAADDTVYLDTLFQGYTGLGSVQRAMMTIEHRTPGLRRYVAYVDGKPAAAASVYLTPSGAYLAGAATVPAMRNRGCQSALIRRRLRDADGHPVVVTTAFGSPSQANLQRHGFAIVHTRTLWRSRHM